ncbi:MAG: XdhC family protein [Alkalispirochaeta sp.]
MRDEQQIREYMERELERDVAVVVATICRVQGSSSRPLGSRMVITSEGTFIGSVSGGCVEGDVARRANEVFRDKVPRTLDYGPVSDPLLEVGLNCDGRIEVILEYVDSQRAEALFPPIGSSLVTRYRMSGDGTAEVTHYWESSNPDTASIAATADTTAMPEAPWYRTTTADGVQWSELVEPRMPKPLLLIVSAGPPAAPLAVFGREMGYRVVVSDPREMYARRELFPAAHEVVCCWPRDLPQVVGVGPGGIGSRCAVVSLNHEPRFEDDLFRMLMEQPPVRYLGALGKRRRHTERIERQSREGFDLDRLPEIHTPIGLDLGGRDPQDIALAIIAEIQAVRTGASGGFLSSREMRSAGPGRSEATSTLYSTYRRG